MERRLAAILVADVVGYSRLMHADEAGTLAALESRFKDMIEPLVANYRGRIVKLMGDGALMEFASAVSAVQCAVEIQAAMDAANESLSEDRRIVMRIGVNLGDIVVRDGDVYGDGVNVAGRLEALAEPGSVTLSQTVFDQVRGKVPFDFEDLGHQNLKNIPEPVRVHRIWRRGVATGGASPTAPSPKPSRAKPSIVVLPFTNMSGDSEQEYFSDGITQDIITDLSQVSAISVIARNTAFTFKGKPTDIGSLARQLKVGYVLEGSIRRSGSRIRVTAQLVDGATGWHIWSERYDRDFADIFALQDDISKCVVSALKVRLLRKEATSIARRSTTNAEAYEYYLHGRSYMFGGFGDRYSLRLARELFIKAAEIDPGYARAYAGIAECDAALWICGGTDISYQEILANSNKALSFAPNLAEAHASKGLALFLSGHVEEATMAFERAIELDSELFEAYEWYGEVCKNTGRFSKGAVLFERAGEVRSTDYISLVLLRDCYASLGLQEQSVDAARRAFARIEAELMRRPNDAMAISCGAATLVSLDENLRAEEWARKATTISPDDHLVHYNAACTYAVIGRFEAALERLEYVFSRTPRVRSWLLGIVKHDVQLDSLRALPDFQNFVDRLEADVSAQSEKSR